MKKAVGLLHYEIYKILKSTVYSSYTSKTKFLNTRKIYWNMLSKTMENLDRKSWILHRSSQLIINSFPRIFALFIFFFKTLSPNPYSTRNDSLISEVMTRGVPSSCRFICAIDFSVSDICPSPPIISLRSTYLWKYKGLLVEPSLTNCLHFRGQIFCYHFCHWFHIKPPFILLQKCAPRRDSQGTKSIIRFKAQNCIIQVLYYCTAWHFSLSEMNFFVKMCVKKKLH